MAMLNSLLEKTSLTHPFRTALLYQNLRIDYASLEKAANQCSRGLLSLGITKGDMVGLVLPNRPEFHYAYFGALKAGATVVPMNPTLSLDELEFMMRDSRVKTLFTIPTLAPGLTELASRLPDHPMVIVTGSDKMKRAISFKDFLHRRRTTAPGIRVDPHNPAVCIYTSGTTGNPKGALLTHANLLANVASILKVFPATQRDVFSCILPLFHAYSATVCMLAPIALAASVVVFDRFSPRYCLQLVQDHRITILVGVPSIYAVLTQIKTPEEFDLTSLRYGISGGAPLAPEILTAFESLYPLKLYEGDGPTECSPVTSVNPIGGKRKVGSIGLPIPDVKMKIVDNQGNDLPPNHVGEIIVSGPNVMKGYLNQPEATAECLIDGWFHTGDVGKMDEDGYFYILDRKKDMLIVGGLNVYSQEVEKVLLSHSSVLEAAVLAKPDKIRGEVPIAFVTPKDGNTIEPERLIAFCREHLAHYKVPREIRVCSTFPKTATGKVMKWKLREHL